MNGIQAPAKVDNIETSIKTVAVVFTSLPESRPMAQEVVVVKITSVQHILPACHVFKHTFIEIKNVI
jgi:hypothetical protein